MGCDVKTRGTVTTRTKKLAVVLAGDSAGRRLRRRAGVPAGRGRGARRQSSTRPWRTTAGRCRRIPTTRTTRSRCSARWWPRRAPISNARRSSRSRISSRRRSASTGWRANTTRATARRPPRWPRSSRHPRSHRGGAAAAGHRAAARAGARRLGRADAQPGVARAAEPPLHRTPACATSSNFIASPTGINITYDRDVAGPRRSRFSSTASRSSRRSTRS